MRDSFFKTKYTLELTILELNNSNIEEFIKVAKELNEGF